MKPRLLFNGSFSPQKHRPVPRYGNVPAPWPGAIPGETRWFLPILPSSFPSPALGKDLRGARCSKKPMQVGWIDAWSLYLKEDKPGHPCCGGRFWLPSLDRRVWELRAWFLPHWREVSFVKSLDGGVRTYNTLLNGDRATWFLIGFTCRRVEIANITCKNTFCISLFVAGI